VKGSNESDTDFSSLSTDHLRTRATKAVLQKISDL
jgi:hypothetical protein